MSEHEPEADESFRYAAMFECDNCGNQMRVGSDLKTGKMQLDGGCPGGCDGSRVTIRRIEEWDVL